MWEKSDSQNQDDVIAQSIKWIATIWSGVLTFFLTPIAYSNTIPFVGGFTARHYGQELVSAVGFVWFPVTALLVFFLLRALTALGLRMAQMLSARIG
ncbi:unnamed protein product [Ectocarpus sp. 12 AP-2014]